MIPENKLKKNFIRSKKSCLKAKDEQLLEDKLTRIIESLDSVNCPEKLI